MVKQSPGIGGNRGSVQRILGRERAYMEEKGLPSSLPQGEGGCESRPHFKIAFFAYVYVYPVISTGGAASIRLFSESEEIERIYMADSHESRTIGVPLQIWYFMVFI